MLFLEPSQILKFAKDHVFITEEDYNLLSKSIDSGFFGEIEKAKRELSHLVKVTTPVVRSGKVVMQTFYINPNKTDKSKFEPHHRTDWQGDIKHLPEAPKAIPMDSNVLKRGDLVKIKLQDGTETVAQFRNFAEVDGKKKAILRAQIKNRKGENVIKTIERNPEDITAVNRPEKQMEEVINKRMFDPNSFSVGNSVSISIRNKKPNSLGITTEEKDGVLMRKTSYGFMVLLPDGSILERPISTLRKTSDDKTKLTEQQQVLLSKAATRIRKDIQEKVDIIEVLERRKPTDWQNSVNKIKQEIESNKNLQFNYFQVFKGNLNFDDIVKGEKNDSNSELIKEANSKSFFRADENPDREDFSTDAFGDTKGVYFTTDKEYASTYGKHISEVKLNFKNPFVVNDINDITDWNFDQNKLEKEGYDGLLYKDPKDGHILAYTFDNKQVKKQT